uniref:Uncharacterized protein n=1 Tax=Ananas comosus var. bracteatus TaxID=296719 RepID=A0A6V7P9Y5_ANACO|nr:unnamed protein product [Ananas comosus var. bracteatus]
MKLGKAIIIGSWKPAAKGFVSTTEGGEEVFVSEAVEDVVKGFTGGSGDPWAEGAAADSKGDVFEDIDREVALKEGGGGVGEEEWGTVEGYKPWTLGEDEETGDVFGTEETEEAEKDVAYEKQKLEEREKELLETLKGFGKVPGYEHVFTDFLLSLVQSKYKRRLANS